MTQETQTYRGRSREYLTKAFKELDDDDLLQASEKGWGAAAQIVKAVADERDLPHRSHADVLRMAQMLVRDMVGKLVADRQFSAASDLHVNFYEGIYNREEVAWRLQEVRRFVDKIEGLLLAG